jgi:hypothetical protein
MLGALVSTSASVWNLHSAHAQSGGTLSGYAWSDMPNISDQNLNPSNTAGGRGAGWISFSCSNENVCGTSNYGVTTDSSGNLSGQAWSENVGWISFSPSDVSGCPSGGTCQANVNQTTGVVTGWARALADTQNQLGGWDGWISLNCSNENVCGTSNYGVTVSGSSWSGYAWGGPVLGWIHFCGSNYCVTGSGTASLNGASISANPTVLATAGTTTVTWSSNGASSCTGTNFSTGGATSGSVPVGVSANTLFSVTCGNAQATSSANVLVSVTYPYLSVSLSASPAKTQKNSTVQLNWSVSQMATSTCSIAQQGGSFSQSVNNDPTSSGSVTSPAIAGTMTFVLTCTGLDSQQHSASVNVGVIPAFQEK